MSAKSDARPHLPPDLSPAEEARWWDEHPSYWDGDAAEEAIPAARPRRTKPVNLRLPVEMIEMLKAEAVRRSIPYQTLIRMWLKEHLDAQRERGSPRVYSKGSDMDTAAPSA